jgi:CBS domain-containing protein
MRNAKVKDLMTSEAVLVTPDATLQEAATKMKDVDCGVLPVGTLDDVQGIITDRDIVIRAVSKGKDITKEKVMDYMTTQVFGCNENDTLEDAAEKMRMHKVSRLIVKNSKGTVKGILSFGGLLRKQADAEEIANIVKHATGTRLA